MRFAAVTRPQQLPVRAPAGDFVRRILTGELRNPAPTAPAHAVEVPADLDQRVRLVGEW
jgi:hypothetical protein